MSAEPIRIMTVDDHPLLREGIGAIVRSQPDLRLVAEATSGREAIEALPRAPARRDAHGPAACPT